MNVQKADLEQFEIDDDCINDDYVDKTNPHYTGRPKWYKTREDENISALDGAKFNDINLIVVKINDVIKSSGLSTALFNDNIRQKRKHKRKTEQCAWFTLECEQKRKAFF